MKSLVIYGTRYGNTQMLAEAIGEVLAAAGTVSVVAADEAPPVINAGIDLVVVGGPTEIHRVTREVTEYLNRVDGIEGMAAAAFDTRIQGMAFFTGSAARGIAHRLRSHGAELVVPPMSFFVEGRNNDAAGEHVTLVAGEVERAKAWAHQVLAKVGVVAPA